MLKKPGLLININLIFAMFVPFILLGKLVRWTIMREVLVDQGVGHRYIRTAFDPRLNFRDGPEFWWDNVMLYPV